VNLVGTDTDVNETHTNQMHVMVDRCKRWSERQKWAIDNDTGFLDGYEGKIWSICEKYSFCKSARRLGHKLFDRNTTYILPGWCAKGDRDNNPDGGLCVLVSTMNLTLNHDRDCRWFAGAVTLVLQNDALFQVGFRDGVERQSVPDGVLSGVCVPTLTRNLRDSQTQQRGHVARAQEQQRGHVHTQLTANANSDG
jgi:hypothetical protein